MAASVVPFVELAAEMEAVEEAVVGVVEAVEAVVEVVLARVSDLSRHNLVGQSLDERH